MNGLTEKSKVRPVLGYSDTETVKLDFDDISFQNAKYWALKTLKKFKLRGFIVLKSSKKCYHVVFDRSVSWRENMRAVAWVALLSHSRGLQKYCLMQCIKTSSTLRVSCKREKPSPRVVLRYGKQDQNVQEFLKMRRIIKKISQKLQKTSCF